MVSRGGQAIRFHERDVRSALRVLATADSLIQASVGSRIAGAVFVVSKDGRVVQVGTYRQLYEEAKDRGIDGRSKMSKAQLERAVGR